MWREVLLHGLPFAHGEASEPYVVVALVAASVLASAGAGILLARVLRADESARPLATAFSAGALVFLLYDLLKETASLGQGLIGRPSLQLALVAAFATGIVAIPILSRGAPSGSRLAWAWTLGIAAHSAGEGWIVGTEAASADVTAPLQAASFMLHKLAEGFTIPFVAALALRVTDAMRYAGALAATAALAALAGHAFGPGPAPLVLFAVGAGAAAFTILRLGSLAPLTARGALAVAAGVAFIYAAGVLHEI